MRNSLIFRKDRKNRTNLKYMARKKEQTESEVNTPAEIVKASEIVPSAPAGEASSIVPPTEAAPQIIESVQPVEPIAPIESVENVGSNDILVNGEKIESGEVKQISAEQLINGESQPPQNGEAKRGRGRPKGSTNKSKEEIAGQSQVNVVDGASIIEGADDSIKLKRAELTAGLTFDMSTHLLATFVGPEWKPKDDAEREMMIGHLKAYYLTKDMPDLPPGVILAFAIGGYGAQRIGQPATSMKIKISWAWLKIKFGGIFGFKRKQVLNQNPNPFAAENSAQ